MTRNNYWVCKIQPNEQGSVAHSLPFAFGLNRRLNAWLKKKCFTFVPGQVYEAMIQRDIIAFTVTVVKDKRFTRQFRYTFLYGSAMNMFSDWSVLDRRILIEKTGHYL